ncbi:MAG TPA: gas vesicle protein [Nocardioidaceae bacterium]|nr:gas vesicle protein [Nocardioidaceae bacterium]
MTDIYSSSSRTPQRTGQPQQLADVLERVLDKGIVIVGDIQVRLLDIELLTIKIRLLVASVDRAREMGINWWEGDAFVSSLEEQEGNGKGKALPSSEETRELQQRVADLEARVGTSDEADAQRQEKRTPDERG